MNKKAVTGKALPKGWRKVKLGETGLVHSGGTPPTRDENNWNGDIFWLTPSEVTKLSQKRIDSTERQITQKGLSSTTLLPSNCLIVCTRATIGDCCINIVPMAINQGFKCIQPYKNHSVVFLYYALQLLKQQLIKLSCGNTFGEVQTKDFENIQIPIPTFPEQKAIASLLETWDTAIEKTEALIAAKSKRFEWLVKTIIESNRKDEWKKANLDEVFSFMKGSGLSKSAITEQGRHKCILYGQLYTTYGEIIEEITARTNSQDGTLSKVGDVLIPASTTTSATDLANATAILENDILLGGDINILRPKKENTDANFYAYYLTHYKKEDLAKAGQGITIIHLYNQNIKYIEVDVPPPSEQKSIANTLKTAQREITSLKQLVEKYRAQKRGLMQKLLAGTWATKGEMT